MNFLRRLFARFRGSPTAMPPKTMDLVCREVVELVTAYHEGALSAPERARFEAHIAMCEACSAYLEQMGRAIAATGKLRAEDVSAEAREALVAAFRGWKAG